MLTTYVLVLEKRGSSGVRLRKRTIFMEEGLYLYVGSAKRGLEKRLERHLRKRKKRFWHIDYITSRGDVAVRTIFLSMLGECETLRAVGSFGTLFGHKLGSSDCTCRSHFVRLTAGNLETAGARLAGLGLKALCRCTIMIS
ncbi:MAG: endonuclease [Deltaproteobacteria bacterium]|nr:endonuclease [Deltaproteobacteria bacterium]